jgi:MoxR-like ATPase
MKTPTPERLPLPPLLHAYIADGLPSAAELGRLPVLGPRFAGVLSASAKFLYVDFIDGADDLDFANALVRFYEACVQPPIHRDTLRRRAGVVRHGLAYLLRGRDPLPLKIDGFLSPAGAYHVAGLGPRFWSALFQGLKRASLPAWTPATMAGLRRLGLDRWRPGDCPSAVYAALQSAYDHIRALQPALSALHVDHFLSRVARMEGRCLGPGEESSEELALRAVQQARARRPLRELLKERGAALARAQAQLEEGLARRDGKDIGEALSAADPDGAASAPVEWGSQGEALTLWVGRLWENDDPYPILKAFWESDPPAGAGLWLPAAALHLRDPQRFAPWSDEARRGYAVLDDSAEIADPPAERYRLFNQGVAWLRERHHLHPLETPRVLASLRPERAERAPARPAFGGFCAETFRFLEELGANNRRDWMEGRRERYRFAVRQPLVELCRALAERYVGPVLHGVHGWDLDRAARSGRALTSVCKNAYGRGGPYNTTLWIVFGRRSAGGGRDEAQFFVRLDAGGLRYGLRLGRKAQAAARLFRANAQRHADLLWRALSDGGALSSCRFGPADAAEPLRPLAGPGDLFEWAGGRSFEASRRLDRDDALLRGDDLAGDVLLTFDRLLPLYACAAGGDPEALLLRRAGAAASGGPFAAADFRRATFLSDDWLRRTLGLLELKRQLILQGVPGTGKTHVARCLARLLTNGRDEAVRLAQFHPAYSYEEFVEGVKVRSVAVDGRHDVTYPVEDGLLCSFAAEAARRPAEPHVLIIDEINRGNLPRIFGELLYLLEYRNQAVELPCSRRAFRLPDNLYLIGAMNGADRSTARLDQALRRRFSFVEMEPDAAVLAAWLAAHPPGEGPAFAERVLGLFERLNARLRADVGPAAQVGHSYFMAAGLDEARLRLVWQHQVRPLLEEHFAAQPARLAAYDIDALLGEPRRPGRRRRAEVPG